MILHPERPEVISVLDWELSTLGDPLTDLATCCLVHYLPEEYPLFPGSSASLSFSAMLDYWRYFGAGIAQLVV